MTETPAAPAFDRMELVPAIVQDARSGQVLMLGYMNEEAYRRTLETGWVTFWSRSRGRLWQKGESSGNGLRLERMVVDCDGDALLVLARPEGPTCHTGRDSCFGVAAPGPLASLERLERVIAQRDRDRPRGSYTAELLAGGPALWGRKVAEEAVEVAFAAAFEGGERLVDESADLLYHLLVALRAAGVTLNQVAERLEERAGSIRENGRQETDLHGSGPAKT